MSLKTVLLNLMIILSAAESIQPSDDPETLIKDPEITKSIKNNNGDPIPPGYYSYVVLFKYKNKSKVRIYNDSDFSTTSLLICSGTILNRRWVITKASSIGHYRTKIYEIVAQPYIPLPLTSSTLLTHTIEWVLLHPDHQPGDITTDVALVRVTKDFKFTLDLRNVNLGFPQIPPTYTNCTMPVWSWFFIDNFNQSRKRIDKGQISLTVITTGCHKDFLCLKPVPPKGPCGLNTGMPIICNTAMVAVYFGNETTRGCSGQVPDMVTALRVDTPFYEKWFEEASYFDDQSDDIMGSAELRMCGGAKKTVSGPTCLIASFLVIRFGTYPNLKLFN
ncbi:serine protease 38-like [Tribolium madens]|uniref:serine protease 38-like n=1 Tax=Tribolium madens TaxID=41895 RepID=UPI001CF71FBB|nr:serine protease 38-like [Tribolium madens]